jgi:Zn-dependent alcohol dehydrogenase
MRAALLERTGSPLVVRDLLLDQPHKGEVLVNGSVGRGVVVPGMSP